ncbi:MAG: lysine transporter LysE [Flavobacteriaceae bacterium]|nr:lysine transporter LysE [Flavobacteriaceae bacterium]
MLEDLQTAIPLGFFLAFMLGPVFFILIETSILKGFRAAIIFDLGVILSDILFILVAYFSSYQLLENISNQPALYVFGGTLLSFYGLNIFIRTPKEKIEPINKDQQKINYSGLFIKGFFLNIINIGVLVFWLGLTIVVTPSLGGSPKREVVFFFSLILTYFLFDLIKILLAKKMKRYLKKQNVLKAKKTLGVIILLCGLLLILKGFLPQETLSPKTIIEDINK